MTPEHLTNEELMHELLSGDWTGHAKDLTDEAARRLRNSIPKPSVEVYEHDSAWYIRINGSDVMNEEALTYYEAQKWLQEVEHALTQGGGDES